MLLCELLEGIAYRLGEDSAPLAPREVERIVTAPTGANAGALYICTERVIEGTRDGMAAALAIFIWCELWALIGLIRKQKMPCFRPKKARLE
jgi:hypothetical protein